MTGLMEQTSAITGRGEALQADPCWISHRIWEYGDLSSLDLINNTKSMDEIVNTGRAKVDERENGSLKGLQHAASHRSLRTSGKETMGFLGLGGGLHLSANEDGVKLEEEESHSSATAGYADNRIGLKLGKRTYFEDTAAIHVDKNAGASVLPGKKQRVSSPAQVPRCQVEGCKLDLTTAKDYHRRHKVCAMHSKSPRVRVASLEQRFCQQCSRFHVLAEFDEGKRSCRRKLAGHNERRRKPQPDTFLLTSGGTSLFQDNRQPHRALGERHYSFNSNQILTNSVQGYGKTTWSKFGSLPMHSGVGYQLQLPGIERYLPNHAQPAAEKLYMLSPHPKGTSTTVRGHRASLLQGSGSLSHGLTLSPSSALLPDLEGTQVSHKYSGVSDSGCALSLLSSHPWSSKAPTSASLDASPKSDLSLEQMIAENRATFAQHFSPGSSTEFPHELPPMSDKCFSMLPLSHEISTIYNEISFPNSNLAETAQRHAPFSVMHDLGNHTRHSFLQDHDLRLLHDANSHHMKPTVDLMAFPLSHMRQMNRSHDSGSSHSASGLYADIQSVKFEPSMFDM
ncbi:hypothetical protein O6H91_05G101800 [Diphasiastrum complanatum]|uniref:Uncharacterized protein n=2 Tax=Diphasiastrum complanatum TaxID=34168 RepID=A0ACC2DRI4_DIPCM|nr:hypothetical protein O6H91_05G101800 [Diphasiastrum complanatum]KAJ7556857.1 hypothetical protein O6H91_05G101800 [Diphasiastrum complanatum]